MSALMDVANKLVEHCKNGTEREALKTLYAEDAVSAEPMPMPGTDSGESHGTQAINGKHDWWESSFEVHSFNVEGPFPHGDDRFAVIFEMDTTEKASGHRSQGKEVAVYTVKDGKITREEFFYAMGG
ncbi:MAG: nuclear transport factor 2 family protein [Pseudomonadota bacterium]